METLAEHMQANIGASIQDPIIDGRWHSGRGQCGKVSYVGHHLPKGLLVRYRHWKTTGDECFTWKEWEGQNIHFDADEYRQCKTESAARSREAEQQAEHDKAALLAILQTIIKESVPADHNHPYPAGKRILALGARQATSRYQVSTAPASQRGQSITPDDLLIPAYGHGGQLCGLQQITPAGKKLMRGSFKGALLWLGGGLATGEHPGRLYICEGWGTACAVHMRTRSPVLAAFSAGNLLAVGQWARARYPDAGLAFCTDNDVGSITKVHGQVIENPGRYFATQAAAAVGGAVVTPPGKHKSDWADWHLAQVTGNKKPGAGQANRVP
jgi:phage/plasmid primase-like uncharacterized protein